MKKEIPILFFTLLFSLAPSCEYITVAEKPCNVEDPLEDLDWLKDIKTSMELNMGMAGSQIIQYTYNDSTVFWVDICYGCADNMIVVYNCKGDEVCRFGGIAGFNTCPDFEENATDKTMLFNNINIE